MEYYLYSSIFTENIMEALLFNMILLAYSVVLV